MNWFTRLYRHVWSGEREAHRLFPDSVLSKIEQAVAASENLHRGELRVVIEGGAGLAAAWEPIDARARAVALFSGLRVWDTQDNSGVLIYLLIAEHRIEIVADRGIDEHVPDETWQEIAHTASQHFAASHGEAGILAVIHACTKLLTHHFPVDGAAPPHNELPDAPILL